MEHKTEKAHALLGASGSHRWLNCTPSARIEERYPDEGSVFAREGSLAHALAAKKLKERLGWDTTEEVAEIASLGLYPDGEMEETTDSYADFVMMRYEAGCRVAAELNGEAEIFIEQRIDYSEYVPEGFGTADVVIATPAYVEVIDFKYGKGVAVEARHNSQMALYALGALALVDYAYDVNSVAMMIYQPRIRNISAWACDPRELKEWGEMVKPLAAVAWEGLGARQSGEWCRFCRAKGDCPRLASDRLAEFIANAGKTDLTPEDRSKILDVLPGIKEWVKTVEERSLALALEGEEIPRYKIVEGRSVRKITNPEAALIELMRYGYEGETLLKPREMKTLTELEKIVGKKKFTELCGEWIEKPAGKPTLVPSNDRREEYNTNDFKDIEL